MASSRIVSEAKVMITGFCSAALLTSVLAFADCAEAGTFFSRTLPAGPDPGSRERTYEVFVPDGLSDQTAAPVVMVLHGCRQNEQNMIDETRFTHIAERDPFIVVFRSSRAIRFCRRAHRTAGASSSSSSAMRGSASRPTCAGSLTQSRASFRGDHLLAFGRVHGERLLTGDPFTRIGRGSAISSCMRFGTQMSIRSMSARAIRPFQSVSTLS